MGKPLTVVVHLFTGCMGLLLFERGSWGFRVFVTSSRGVSFDISNELSVDAGAGWYGSSNTSDNSVELFPPEERPDRFIILREACSLRVS